MDLSLTPEQEMLKTAVRRFVQQEYPKETLLQIASPTEPTPDAPWQQLTQTGWLGILIPTEYGGEGGSFTDAGVLFEELGRGPVPGPHISSAVLAALTLLEGGTEEQKKDWLPRMATGEVRMVAAITEADYGWLESDVRLTAKRNGDGYRLNGKKAYVYDGESATHLLCAARSEESNDVGLVIVPAGSPGIGTRHLPGFAWNLSEIAFEDVPADSAQVLG
ncbi:MAG: acyl-CoA/acyl-ACP dehydrogenase, partial [Chloroflexi bacterium]|nr:acyl-CoA/acyl-ACP dehydrogenase [Chloroflexota bacterium]